MVSLLLAVIYLAFISLGLPDSALGSAWPSMYGDLNVPISYVGILSMLIAIGTIVSSLFSDIITKKLGAGRVTAISVTITAAAMLGFSITKSFWVLCILAIPYGLGAGSVDAALNNFVALHYESHHMSWLHGMWGVGTVIGPNIMSFALIGGKTWSDGYRYISFLQMGLSLILVLSLPLWKKKAALNTDSSSCEGSTEAIPPWQVIRIRGAKEILISFFCYCAIEQTAMIWAGSYMVLHNGMSPVKAAGCASVLFVGITVGRFLNGFLTFKFNDNQMIHMGEALIVLGAVILLLPVGSFVSIVGFIAIGLGCAPIYPCIIHSTPERFGADKSQAMIGVQMASAYIGTCLMPPIFGFIANYINISFLPVYLLILVGLMIFVYERLLKKTA